jgi:hypothetical protein
MDPIIPRWSGHARETRFRTKTKSRDCTVANVVELQDAANDASAAATRSVVESCFNHTFTTQATKESVSN